MKVTFDFDMPEDNEDFEIYQSAKKMYCMLTEMKAELRKANKYEPENTMTSEKIWNDFIDRIAIYGLSELID